MFQRKFQLICLHIEDAPDPPRQTVQRIAVGRMRITADIGDQIFLRNNHDLILQIAGQVHEILIAGDMTVIGIVGNDILNLFPVRWMPLRKDPFLQTALHIGIRLVPGFLIIVHRPFPAGNAPDTAIA